jgi:hypothetical protein
MISLMTQTAVTRMPVGLPAASSPLFRHRLAPIFAGLGGEVCPEAITQVGTQVSDAERAPQMSGVRAGGLPGYPSALVQARLSAVDVPTIAAPPTSVRTTTVRNGNDKHDPGPSVLRPPV